MFRQLIASKVNTKRTTPVVSSLSYAFSRDTPSPSVTTPFPASQ